MKPNEARLAKRLREARHKSGMSIRELEAQTGVNRGAISRFELTGKGSADNLLTLARALELSASSVFSDAGRAAPKPVLSLPAMLRAEYDLPPEAIKQIQDNIEQVARKYKRNDYE